MRTLTKPATLSGILCWNFKNCQIDILFGMERRLDLLERTEPPEGSHSLLESAALASVNTLRRMDVHVLMSSDANS